MLVVDATQGLTPADQELIALFQEKDIPYLVAYNKSDLAAAPQLGGKGAGRQRRDKRGH